MMESFLFYLDGSALEAAEQSHDGAGFQFYLNGSPVVTFSPVNSGHWFVGL
jgi:hypothetical protein